VVTLEREYNFEVRFWKYTLAVESGDNGEMDARHVVNSFWHSVENGRGDFIVLAHHIYL